MKWLRIAVRGPPTGEPELRYLGPQQSLNGAHGSDGRNVEAVSGRRLDPGAPAREPGRHSSEGSRRGTESPGNLEWRQEMPEPAIARRGNGPGGGRHARGIT